MIDLIHVKLHQQMIDEQFNKRVSFSIASKRKRPMTLDVLAFFGNRLIKIGDAMLKLSNGVSYSTR
jgi:hypothetical protein